MAALSSRSRSRAASPAAKPATRRRMRAARGAVVGQEGRNVAGERAGVADGLAPLLAGLPPALVTDIVAEAEEDRQHQPDQAEGRQRNFRQQARLEPIERGDGDGDDGDHENMRPDAGDDRAAQGEQHGRDIELLLDDHGAFPFAPRLWHCRRIGGKPIFSGGGRASIRRRRIFSLARQIFLGGAGAFQHRDEDGRA